MAITSVRIRGHTRFVTKITASRKWLCHPTCRVAIPEEIMNSAPAVMVDEKESSVLELSITESEQLPLAEAPEISHGARKVIIFLLVGSALFLASVGAYVLSGLHRFQNCL
jgi:hypothetical protein